MRSAFWLLLCFVPSVLPGQELDLTGRVSMRVQNVSYDETSAIRPDSISEKDYAKSNLVPGLQQMLNISLFGRKEKMDMTLLADIKNTEWNSLNFSDLRSISRFTLDVRYTKHHFVLGDFFESFSETYMQSREIRGGKYALHIDDLLGANTFFDIRAMGGIVQKAYDQGHRLQDLYRQYETSGQYRRILGSGDIQFGKRGVFDLSFNYLQGNDQESSIDTSINYPFSNRLFGGLANFYLWDRNIRLFGEFFSSRLDTLTAGQNTDNTYHAGFDFRYEAFKLILLYQRIGFNYFTAGYPFLETDKKGIKGQVGYLFPQTLALSSEFEFYDDNLEQQADTPTTSTKIIDIAVTTFFPDWPEFNLKYGIRTDDSDAKLVEVEDELVPVKTDKTTLRYEGGIAYRFDHTRLSLSGIYLDLDDQSLLSSGDPLGTEQIIMSFNIYTTGIRNFFLSAGLVHSTLKMTDQRKNSNFFIYESNRWDVIPMRLKLESTLTYLINDAANGGIPDVLSDYNQVSGELSLEYFFNNYVSLKIIAGTDIRQFKYSTEEALEIIAMDEYGPAYFNLNESYSGLIVGGELNWIF